MNISKLQSAKPFFYNDFSAPNFNTLFSADNAAAMHHPLIAAFLENQKALLEAYNGKPHFIRSIQDGTDRVVLLSDTASNKAFKYDGKTFTALNGSTGNTKIDDLIQAYDRLTAAKKAQDEDKVVIGRAKDAIGKSSIVEVSGDFDTKTKITPPQEEKDALTDLRRALPGAFGDLSERIVQIRQTKDAGLPVQSLEEGLEAASQKAIDDKMGEQSVNSIVRKIQGLKSGLTVSSEEF